MNELSINQISTLKGILEQKQWMITQFGEKEIEEHLYDVIKGLTLKQYKYILFLKNQPKGTGIIRDILINNGLKPL